MSESVYWHNLAPVQREDEQQQMQFNSNCNKYKKQKNKQLEKNRIDDGIWKP